ncbi:MAG: hypothetical protein ACT4PW_12505 [Acidimicrobiia bacterium]
MVYDIDGPRVRLGVAWFLLCSTAWIAGPWGLTVVYGLAAGIAAAQTAGCWRPLGLRPSRQAAGLGAAALVVAAALSTAVLGAVVLALVAASVAPTVRMAPIRRRRRRIMPIEHAACTVRCGLFVGLGAASIVLADRSAAGAAIGLLLLVSAYEVGDYLVGSGSSNPYEGPAAGAIAQLVVAFAITAIGVEPFTFPGGLLMGAMAAVLTPLGQLLASAVLPTAGAPASALRRLDSLLLLGPAWALVIGLPG